MSPGVSDGPRMYLLRLVSILRCCQVTLQRQVSPLQGLVATDPVVYQWHGCFSHEQNDPLDVKLHAQITYSGAMVRDRVKM